MKRFKRLLKWTAIITLCLLVSGALVISGYMQQAKFGAAPSGKRLTQIATSPEYRSGKFHNTVERPSLAEGHTFWGELNDYFFGKHPRRSPRAQVPSIKTDLSSIPRDSNVVIWLGHSTCFIQADGIRFLTDPSLSGNASPIPGTVPAFRGANIYSPDDIPDIDYVLVSHDHYDHFDYETMRNLRGRVKHVVCGLGIGAHLERWHYSPEQIIERDWHQQAVSGNGVLIYTEEAAHFSGRTFIQDRALWVSFVIQTPSTRIFYSGDGGYGKHFATIGAKYGPFDLALMECGQYDKAWHYVHLLPEEVVKASVDVKAKQVLPVHNSKFQLAKHPWDEPLEKMLALSAGKPYRLATPMIGEPFKIGDTTHRFTQWWKYEVY
ncbi:MBL fold metallo-hydrolase [uncultured Chitinophaga sp.]|uniref:MBL fold metallo-hydrolase n=1 Tax=uncultured Chitinophaga sp. TaxID=339340 RepID=UPI0025E8DB13|nr:MBL fold metallo-hydrolase [uncultured Chitinophaga sp.]